MPERPFCVKEVFSTSILNNSVLLIGLVAWIGSQCTKTIIHLIIHKKFVWERFFGDGGMPSSHSATVCAVATAIGMRVGWDSPLFALSVVLAMVVMHDAKGVRQETGKQAKVINSLLELFESMGRGDLTPEETLKEFVGHTRRQVYVGAAFGIVIALLMNTLLP